MTFGLGMNFGAGGVGEQVEIIQGQSQSIHLDIDQTGSVQIPAVEASGSALDFTGMTLKFVATDYRKATVLTVLNDGISHGSGTFTIPLNIDATSKKRTLRWRLLDVTGGGEVEIIDGLFPVY